MKWRRGGYCCVSQVWFLEARSGGLGVVGGLFNFRSGWIFFDVNLTLQLGKRLEAATE